MSIYKQSLQLCFTIIIIIIVVIIYIVIDNIIICTSNVYKLLLVVKCFEMNVDALL